VDFLIEGFGQEISIAVDEVNKR